MRVVYYGREVEFVRVEHPYDISVHSTKRLIDLLDNLSYVYLTRVKLNVLKDDIEVNKYETERNYIEFDNVLNRDKYVLIKNSTYRITSKVYDIETDTLKIYTEYTTKCHEVDDIEKLEVERKLKEMIEVELELRKKKEERKEETKDIQTLESIQLEHKKETPNKKWYQFLK